MSGGRRLLLPALLLLLAFAWQRFAGSSLPVVRGKGPAVPLGGQLGPLESLAQDLALSDARVQQLTVGRRSEVIFVGRVGGQFTANAAPCATAPCRQVSIYNWEENSTVLALVDPGSRQVLDVLFQPGVQPGLNAALSARARQIAFAAPEVIAALGFRPQPDQVQVTPMHAGMNTTPCRRQHLCAGATFKLGDRILWAVVDLTVERLAGIAWTEMQPETGVPRPPENHCPDPGDIERDGWSFHYEVSDTDGLWFSDLSYQGRLIMRSLKTVEWHVDYGGWGFLDQIGCLPFPPGSSGIAPYGDPELRDLRDPVGQVVGFEFLQDFRMDEWGDYCNYRYEERLQFYRDGRLRLVSGSYGKGCGSNALYRPVLRLDLAVDGDQGDTVWRNLGDFWVPEDVEGWWREDGPYTPEGYQWRVEDEAGRGYFLAPDQGQFGDGSRGDDAFVYLTLFHPEEGATDLGIIGPCCDDGNEQGPDLYLNGEAVDDADVVLWYVPQFATDAYDDDGDGRYCWTVSGEPEPETVPCFSGPMLVPTLGYSPTASFTHTQPLVAGIPVSFTNWSTGSAPLTSTWSFGDGSQPVATFSPWHTFAAAGQYSVTLTVQNGLDLDWLSLPVTVLPAGPPPRQHYLPLLRRPPG